MSHDPFCPNAKGCSHDCGGCSCNLDAFCQCDLIAEVRADEARMAANRICFVDVVARGEVYEDAWIRRNDAIMEAGRGEDVGFLRQFGLEPTREDYDRQRAIAAELTRMAQEDGFIP